MWVRCRRAQRQKEVNGDVFRGGGGWGVLFEAGLRRQISNALGIKRGQRGGVGAEGRTEATGIMNRIYDVGIRARSTV